MPPLIKGSDLTPAQRAEVLGAFVHRITHENAERAKRLFPNFAPSLYVSDDDWIAAHAFYFNKNGKLTRYRRWSEPAFMAEPRVFSDSTVYLDRADKRAIFDAINVAWLSARKRPSPWPAEHQTHVGRLRGLLDVLSAPLTPNEETDGKPDGK